MRWNVKENKIMTETKDLEGHFESLEMSGERVSGIIGYGAKGGELVLTRDIVFPAFRIQPNNTHGSFCVRKAEPPRLLGAEEFDKAQISGILTLYSHTENAGIIRRFYPSATLACFYEDVEITATGDVEPVYEQEKRLQTTLGCEGFIYFDRVADFKARPIKKGETRRVIFTYRAYFANQTPPAEKDALEMRLERVKELLNICDLTTGDSVIDTEFAFAKIRAGESLFRTKKGLIHCPGGYDYYGAVWCNDQLEYAAPWFAFTGDKKATEASENAFSWYLPFMNDEYRAIPSSIIAEGFDYWNGAGDRGDAAMYLYGLSRYLLTLGKAPDKEQEKALKWCVRYIEKNTAKGGEVYSDSDELEGRISTGINLSTAALSYGGLELVSLIWKKCGRKELCLEAESLKERVKRAFEGYFAANINGYYTYAYHKGCEGIRTWNCLPVYMGVSDRAKDTLAAIENTLWDGCGCKTYEGEKMTWDRSTLYFIAALFRAGQCEKALSMLKAYSKERLLGERVPYPVEAYPEGNMRHLSAESALYCRVITDGLFNISFGENGFSYRKSAPFMPGGAVLEKVFIDGKFRNLEIK